MRLSATTSSMFRWLLLTLLASCAGELEHDPSAAPEDLPALGARDRGHDRGRKKDDGPVPCASADASALVLTDAGSPGDERSDAPGPGDAGRDLKPDAGETLVSSSALGANLGDACSPSGEAKMPWALCETRRGLRCQRPPADEVDAPSACACPPEAAFANGVCSTHDWGLAESSDAGTAPLSISSALGANPRDLCGPSAFPGPRWAECDARRGLVCGRASGSTDPRGRMQDTTRSCYCPEGTTFVDGLCTKN